MSLPAASNGLPSASSWRHEAEVACLKSGQVKEGPTLVRVQPITGPGVCGADFPLKVAAIGEGSTMGYAEELRPPGSIPGPRQPLAYPPPPAPNYSPVPPPQYQPIRRNRPTRSSNRPIRRSSRLSAAAAGLSAQQPYPPQRPYQPAGQPANGPMSIYAPGVTPPEPDAAEEEPDQPEESAQPYPQRAPAMARPTAERARAVLPRSPIRRSHIRRAVSSQPYPAQPYPAQPAEQVPLGRERMPVTTGAVAVQPTATLACPIVSALDTWFASGVQPAALKWFGVQVAEIRQISAYSCRGMNGQAGARISEHAFGNALDIASFTLADGRKITVKDGWRGLARGAGFPARRACLGLPAVHHRAGAGLERVPLRPHPCRPDAAFEPAADLQSGRRPRRRGRGARRLSLRPRGEPGITGSIKPQPARKPAFFQPFGRDEVYDKLPRAVPGED